MSKTKYSKVVIIGAGFSGLAMACQLQDKFGEFDYTIYERSKEVGGTWSANKCTFAHFLSVAAALRLRNKQTPAAPSTSRQHCTVSRSRPIRASPSCVPARRRCSTTSTRSPTGIESCSTSRARRSGKGRNGRKTGRRGECGCGIWSMARCSSTSARS